MRYPRSLAAHALMLLCVLPACVVAQAIHGTVTTTGTSAAVTRAEVLLIKLDGRRYGAVSTDTHGEFFIPTTTAGEHAIWVRKIGFRPSLTMLSVDADDTVQVAIELQESVIELEGITVYGLAVATEGQREFWTRRDLAWSVTADYQQIEQLHVGNMEWLLRLLPGQTRCSNALVYIDGWERSMPELLEMPLRWVYGIEVYRSFYDIPNRYRAAADPRASCGAILVWTTAIGQRK